MEKNNEDNEIGIENPLIVTIPNGKQIISNKTIMLDIPGVLVSANKA